ncbi:MAG: Crp/Fnr family transcriptional regulator [Methylibium sp.]|uniref:Crp/Fnr family transcriptional regulator n=1 Tax=Methylibium sp. TaxID=2067992 RepID=UPI00182307C2|nr:Crp/Fnr family transcriptional regulator [Methylibium sp.]MBA2723334.1 Crp/Fnr family transcriptional regulator [Methylibium sp.]MBA3588383.1 Crp/Fnr family transcriptional regulator [Methylibium sp.]MBA3623754.1 Crp/Fnr family transcriptional regulator [Methylibium sp.]
MTPENHDLIERLPASEALRALAARGDIRRYRKGTLLIQEGDEGDTLYLILAGRLRAYSAGETGREITYGLYEPGEYLGEMSLDGGPRSASVIALEPTVCAVVTQRTLRGFIGERPEFAFELMAKLIRRARVATLSAKQLALNDVYGRLVALLNSLALPQPDGSRQIGMHMTHREMANRLGCSREMVSRLMKDLEAGGFVKADTPGLRLLRVLPARW